MPPVLPTERRKRLGLPTIPARSLIGNLHATAQPPYVISADEVSDLVKHEMFTGIPKIAVLGDSRAAQMSYDLTNHDTYSATGLMAWVNVKSKGKYIVPAEYNFGVSGDTSTQILARTPDAAASNAEVVVYIGGTNDRNSSELQSAATTIANITESINLLVAAGKKVILCTDMPRGNATYTAGLLTSQQLRYHQQIRRWTLDTARLIPGVLVADLYPLLADNTRTDGAMLVTYTYDGTHLNPVGAERAANPVVAILDALYPAPFYIPDYDNGSVWHATDNVRGNMISNGAMTGTAGTPGASSSGNLADSWTGTRNAAMNSGTVTSVFAKVARTDVVGSWQQVTIGGTAGATADPNLEIYIAAPNGNFSEGDVIQAIGEFEIDSGATGLKGVTLRTTQTVGGVAKTSSALLFKDAANPFPSGFTGTNKLLMVTRPEVIPAGSVTSVRVRIEIDLVEGVATTAVIRWGNIRLQKVI